MGDSGRIGLVAVPREILPLYDVLKQESEERYGASILRSGTAGGRPVALAEVPTGPVNAALGAQALVTRHRVTALLSFGSAGALAGGLSTGDLVIAQRAIAHDAGTFLGGRFEPSGIVARGGQGRIGWRRSFEADPGLVAQALDAAQRLGVQARAGTVVTGNQVIFSTARRRWLRRTFDALAVEMETAAVAQVAVAHKLPWVAVRAISDAASDELMLDYRRLRFYLDDGRPAWRCRADRWSYLLTHPAAWRRFRHLRRGLARATEQASRLVEAMLLD
jgi:5'-methylthioadenosine/S-adenosylhomocysteine nucleosidase